MGPHLSTTLIAFAQNDQSILTKSRLQNLENELSSITFHRLLLSETWRHEKQDRFTSANKHVFSSAAAAVAGAVGLALFSPRRFSTNAHTNVALHAIDDRVCAVDFVHAGRSWRGIACYKPASWKHDVTEVEGIYERLSRLIAEARQQHRFVLLGGDFNAAIGPVLPHDYLQHIGPHGYGNRSVWGEMLRHFCVRHDLVTANRQFPPEPDHAITCKYTNGAHGQIDFILRGRLLTVDEAQTSRLIGVGLDHHTVIATIKAPAQTTHHRRQRKPTTNWKETKP